MSLEVTVASASNLPNLESMGKIDPYVNIEFQGKVTQQSKPFRASDNTVTSLLLSFFAIFTIWLTLQFLVCCCLSLDEISGYTDGS
jgi:C2 domain